MDDKLKKLIDKAEKQIFELEDTLFEIMQTHTSVSYTLCVGGYQIATAKIKIGNDYEYQRPLFINKGENKE